MENFAESLKTARKKAGITQQVMADRMLIPKRTIEAWETGDRTPPPYVQRFVLNELQSLAMHKPVIDRATYERAAHTLNEEREANHYTPPLGYKLEDGKLVVNEEEAEVVNRALVEMERDGQVSSETEKELRRVWASHYDEARRAELPRVSEEKLKDLINRFDAGVKASDVFKYTRKK